MTTLSTILLDIHIVIMTFFDSPATLEAYLTSCPSITGMFLVYFRRIVQSVLERSFEEEQLRRYFYAILIVHFDNPSHTDTVVPFLSHFFHQNPSANLVLPSCVPHSMEALEYIVSIQLALDYFYPCAEDSVTDWKFVYKFQVVDARTLNGTRWDWDVVRFHSRRALLRIQLEAELFHDITGRWDNIPTYRFFWQRYHRSDIRECRNAMRMLAHWMRQKLGIDAIPRNPEIYHYFRATDIEPPRRLNCIGLPQLHQVAEDGPYAQSCKQYAFRFLAQKASWGPREDEIRIPPRRMSSRCPIFLWDGEILHRFPTDLSLSNGHANAQLEVIWPSPLRQAS